MGSSQVELSLLAARAKVRKMQARVDAAKQALSEANGDLRKRLNEARGDLNQANNQLERIFQQLEEGDAGHSSKDDAKSEGKRSA